MTAISFYLTSVQNEFVKLKRTFASWLTVICVFLIPILFFIVYFVEWESIIPAAGINPWDQFVDEQVRKTLAFIAPMFIVLITSLIIQIEHKSSALKQLFTNPTPKWSTYFGKLSVILILTMVAYIFYYGLVVVNGKLLGILRPGLKFSEFSPDYLFHTKILVRSYLSVLAILAIQFWMSFRFKNFIVSLGIGMVLVIIGLIATQAKEAIYFPYSYAVLGVQPIDEGVGDPSLYWWFPKVAWYSIGCFVIVSILGYLDIRRMNVK